MFFHKNIVVTIGNNGAVIAFHNAEAINNKFFLNELNEESKAELKNIFIKNQSAPIYILLDTSDQSYKKKTYPLIHKSDLIRIIKRDIASSGDKESLKNYIILNSKKTLAKKQNTDKRWECLFVSSSNSQIINNWLDFLIELPNHLVGIYMLPVEAFSFFQLLKDDIKRQSKLRSKKNNFYCLIIKNKISETRQIVFSEQGIVFTRIVDYDSERPDFLERYEQDIYSTFEYLKRLFPDLAIAEIDFINILPDQFLKLVKKIDSVELNFINYTPFEAAAKVGYNKLLAPDSSFCDLLISKAFSQKKKILKFTIPKIANLEKFFFTLRISYYLNLLLLVGTFAVAVFTIFFQNKLGDAITAAESGKFSAFENFRKFKKEALQGIQGNNDDSKIDIRKINDFGKMSEILGSAGNNVSDFYVKLQFLKNFDVKLNSFSYLMVNFNSKFPAANNVYSINFSGEIFNKSGDIEDLFKEFDTLAAEVKKNLSKNQVKYSDLPRDIDFNQKYYKFPIEFTVTGSSS